MTQAPSISGWSHINVGAALVLWRGSCMPPLPASGGVQRLNIVQAGVDVTPGDVVGV